MTQSSAFQDSADPIRLYLVDCPTTESGPLRDVVNGFSGMVVAGEARTFSQALDLFQRGLPDVGVFHLAAVPSHGFACLRNLRLAHPEARLLAVSVQNELLCAPRALRAGAKGYVMRTAEPREIERAIRQVHAGRIVVGERVRDMLLSRTAGRLDECERMVHDLSDAELTIFEALGRGMCPRDIAAAMGIAPGPWRTHCERIKRKLGCAGLRDVSREAVAFAQRHAR